MKHFISEFFYSYVLHVRVTTGMRLRYLQLHYIEIEMRWKCILFSFIERFVFLIVTLSISCCGISTFLCFCFWHFEMTSLRLTYEHFLKSFLCFSRILRMSKICICFVDVSFSFFRWETLILSALLKSLRRWRCITFSQQHLNLNSAGWKKFYELTSSEICKFMDLVETKNNRLPFMMSTHLLSSR